ncbi:hypothetical protein ACLKA6_015009 [Drosophila palustris]
MAHYLDGHDDGNNPYYNNFGSKSTICPVNATCLDGTFNFLCKENPMAMSEKCKRFVPMPVTMQSRARMVNVHNGLRNKLAYENRLANMNLVYWNVQLQAMAERYLRLCRPYRDTCLVVGYDATVVGHNTLFVPKRHLKVLVEWEGRTVRHWFLKLGSETVTLQDVIDDEFKEQKTISQLIWPSLEFIGCSAATMFDGFFIVCYYYPPPDTLHKLSFTYLKKDESCVCPPQRLMCSLVFTSLCGIDLNIYSRARKIGTSATNWHFQILGQAKEPSIGV